MAVAQRLYLQGLEVGVVDLVEAMGAQVHGGRSRGWAIVFHTRLVRGSQPLLGGGVNGYTTNVSYPSAID